MTNPLKEFMKPLQQEVSFKYSVEDNFFYFNSNIGIFKIKPVPNDGIWMMDEKDKGKKDLCNIHFAPIFDPKKAYLALIKNPDGTSSSTAGVIACEEYIKELYHTILNDMSKVCSDRCLINDHDKKETE